MKNIFTIILLILISTLANAQEKPSKNLRILLNGGVLAGAEVNRNTGNFKLAPNLHTGLLYLINKQVAVGGGLGIEWFDDETVLPVYAMMYLYKKSEAATPFFAAHAGYAAAWHEEYVNLENYEMIGGWRMGFEYGWQIPVSEQLAVSLGLGLNFQQLLIDIDTGFSDDYSESVTYVLLGFKTGVVF